MRFCAVLLLFLPVGVAAAQPPYHNTPDWVSSDTQVSTGAALADIDLDGWLDLVVSNGNDISLETVAVYYNNGDGTFPLLPNWESSETQYNGHLDIADVNGDGWLDIAVATLGAYSNIGPIARVYLNNSGTLSATADWEADIDGNAFGVAFGDVNNDGRPDLAVATGWAYDPQNHYPTYVYLNVAGTLEASASWSSTDTNHAQGALWVDADDDGWLDLAVAASRSQSKIYRNLGGTLETTASWATTDNPNQDAIMLAAGDVAGDGVRELFITDNNQLSGGSGRFRQFDGISSPGLFSTNYSWSYAEGYCSAIALADVDADGALDVATGAWWDSVRIFRNSGSGLPVAPTWSSATSTVVEKIVFGDIDKNALRTVHAAFPAVPAITHLYYLPHQPVQAIVEVRRNGVVLTPAEYTYSAANGWLTVAPIVGDVEVDYTVSSRLDMAVTNWDGNIGNQVYYNQLVALGDANCDGSVDLFDVDPFVALLSNRPAYDAEFPDCDADTFCDMNGDGAVDLFDVDGFVDALTG